MSKVTFRLVRSMSGTHYWTSFLPTQIKHESSEVEAIKNLAKVIDCIQRGDFELERLDLVVGDGPKNFVGGIRHLLSFVNKAKKGKVNASMCVSVSKSGKKPTRPKAPVLRKVRTVVDPRTRKLSRVVRGRTTKKVKILSIQRSKNRKK